MVAFSPSAPTDKYSLFAGRQEQTNRVFNAVLQRGQHAIIYGERGVGKTSLAKVLAEILSSAGMKIVDSDTINCDATDDFSSLWHKALREVSFKIKTSAVYFGKTDSDVEINLNALVTEKIAPDDVRRALSTLDVPTVIIFDEFDRIQSKEAKTLMADTIKNLSDHNINTTLLLVGVGQSVVDLVAEHRSIERALVEVPMPRMSRTELTQIIHMGLARIGGKILIAPSVVNKVVWMSHGLPHYTHLLALEAGRAAIQRGSLTIEDEDFVSAVATIVSAKHTVAAQYYSSVSSSYKTSKHKITLLACALTPIDDHGFFTAADVAKTLGQLHQRTCTVSEIQKHLTEFVSEKRGGVLHRQGTQRRYKYRFSNPLVQPYTIIHSLSENLITESQVWLLDQSFGNSNKSVKVGA